MSFIDEQRDWWDDGAFHYVSSSNVSGFLYLRDERALVIEFHGGRRYKYFSISPETAAGLASASSPGGWFHANLKGAPFERL